MPQFHWLLIAIVAVLFLTACAAPQGPATASFTDRGTSAVSVTIYRSPDCSCCHEWADLARHRGWVVASVDKLDMTRFKADAGVPAGSSSCHTAIIEGYFVEGHVPFEAVERLLVERPAIDGIALPGMPAGSPGMAGAQDAPFEVLAVVDGEVTPFGSY
jgi:hypothetical protein